MLHVDWTALARFAEPGHAVTGNRTSWAAKKRRKLGYDVVHAIVDDQLPARLRRGARRGDAWKPGASQADDEVKLPAKRANA